MNPTAHFPWAMVASNAVWICGLAVILAAFGWHDGKRRERDSAGGGRDAAAGFSVRSSVLSHLRGDSFKKPALLGLIMVAGGAALSVRSPMLAAIFAIATFGLVVAFVKLFLRGTAKSTNDDEERRRARSAAGQGASRLGDLAEDHDKHLAEAADDKD